MTKSLLLLTLTFLIISCAQVKNMNERRCKSTFENDYSTILEEKYESVINNDTIILNEVKYECVYTSFYIQKGMFDRFGKWNMISNKSKGPFPILIWNNVQLFPNDSTKFIVAANGVENMETIYTSVLVFDKNNNDLLAEDSEYKSKLVEYFSEMIRSNNPKQDSFYEAYWTTFDPERWQRILEYRKYQ